jgi:hypothetical protein
MIAADISTMHTQNLNRFASIERGQSELRERIIGIDGNGTGREGALQRQDKVLARLVEGHAEMSDNITTLVNRSQSWNKKNVWEFAKWVIGGLGALGTVLLGMYIGHIMGWVR